jgi:hypothetical protein
MSNISHVTAPLAAPAHRNDSPRGRDFADELGRADDRKPETHSHRPAANGHGPHTASAVVPPTTRGAGSPAAKAAASSPASESVASGFAVGVPGKAGVPSAPQPDATVQPTGVTEALIGSRVFGVHLLAGAYLSELYAPGCHGASLASSSPALSGSEGVAEWRDAPFGAPGRANPAMAVALPQDQAAPALDLFARTPAEVAGEEVRSAAATAPEASREMLWSEDSLRLTKQADGSLALWLRDYRMDDAQAARVVDAMVKEARSRGMQLGRILWNGREVWTSLNQY